MPRFKTRFTVDGIEHRGHTTADNEASAWQKIHAAAASAFPGQTITVGYVVEEKQAHKDAALQTLKNIFGI